MVASLAMATFALLGTLANGLDCTFTERCRSGLCDSVEAPMKVLFSPTAIPSKPSVFVLGDARLFEGRAVTAAEVRAMTTMFRDFRFQPDTYAYAPAGMSGYDPAQGSVQFAVGERLVTVAADGKARVDPVREGLPGLDWITSFSGQCSARIYE